VECLLWDAVAASFLARFWATDVEVEARFDRWRLGHRRWSARWAWVVTRVIPCDGRAVRGAVDGFAAPVSWKVTLEITGWVVVVAGHLGLKGAVVKAVRCRVPRRPGLNSVR
jgi:hypothetical protein